MALHANSSTCVQPTDVQQSGTTVNTGCSDEGGTVGCRVTETKPNSLGDGFNQNQGGVFALQYDVSGAYIWFWSVSLFRSEFYTLHKLDFSDKIYPYLFKTPHQHQI